MDDDPELARLRARRLEELRHPPAPVEVTDATLPDVLARNPVVVLDLWAAWCGPCRVMAPVVDELARDLAGTALVAKLDVDANPATPRSLGVRGIPTFVVFKGGKPVERVVGAVPKAHLEAAVRRAAD